MEPKMLPPTLRAKKRYLAFEVVSASPISYNDLVDALWNGILSFMGELEASEAKLWLIHNLYDPAAQRGVIKCKSTHVEHVRATLALISVIGEARAVVRIIGVTGTIKSAKEKYLKTGREQAISGATKPQ